jgi:dynein heavy chain
MESENEVDEDALRFLMTGGISLDENLPEKPAAGWVLEKMWAEIYRMSSLASFEDFYLSFGDNIDAWKAIFDSANP